MSKRSSRRPLSTPAQPRALADIGKEYAEIKNKLADAQYLHYVYGQEVDILSKKMLQLNQEGAARNQLDAQPAKPVEATLVQETENVNS